MLDFVVIGFMLCVALYHVSVWLLHWLVWARHGILVSCNGALSKEEGGATSVPPHSPSFIKNKVQKPSYMAIKKALVGRQPKWFYFGFSFESLLQQESLLLVFLSEFSIKYQVLLILDVIKLIYIWGVADSARCCLMHEFWDLFCSS